MLVQHQLSLPDKKMCVIWVDRQNLLASRELEMAGIYGSLESFELNMPLLPLETDLFSLELPSNGKADLVAAAQSIFQLQVQTILFNCIVIFSDFVRLNTHCLRAW